MAGFFYRPHYSGTGLMQFGLRLVESEPCAMAQIFKDDFISTLVIG